MVKHKISCHSLEWMKQNMQSPGVAAANRPDPEKLWDKIRTADCLLYPIYQYLLEEALSYFVLLPRSREE